MNLHNVEFIKSVAKAEEIIRDKKTQIVFSGKSNVGKSSVINKLLNRKQFARVSATPGKTIHINYFLIDKTAYFVDLPGYGYAKVSKSERMRWSNLMESFFKEYSHITLGCMIVDARHKPTSDDCIMAEWFKATGCPLIVAANKFDKVKSSQKEQNILLIRETLNLHDDADVIGFSALKGTGKDELLYRIVGYSKGSLQKP
ncbi:MAG: ribosome biogenesis GTP-binding protein YihA/YsxC [Oscillospiraceae bacterium]|nr:ribosome biogenesis GTP-binding protein YihA/YsxC [Oscillospiraceae bacterium]